VSRRPAPVPAAGVRPRPVDVVGVVAMGGLPCSGAEWTLYLHTGLEERFRCIFLFVPMTAGLPRDRSERGLHPLLVAAPALLTDDFRDAALAVLAVPLVRGGDRA
jgi:hypothetical protein